MNAEGIQTLLLALTALVTAMTPLMLALINRRQKQIATEATKAADAVRDALVATNEQTERKLDEIQHTVNSERDRLLEKIEGLRQEVLRLNAYKALREQQDERG